ncbi:spore germination protein gerkc [hydrocarbon metagenome]|uniref:Spore germination protein gerkc n=1 Tax=hydrocarbon metagenome TaxID=938273 RepID=A0A0W8EA23_9ZZZZ
MVIAHGWDLEGQNTLLSAQLALTPPREGQLDTGPRFLVVSSAAATFVEAGRRLSLSLPRRPLWSMADTIVISEELARKDSYLFIDTATRNPRIRFNVSLFLSKGASPEDIFNTEVPPENYSGTALEKLIENQSGQAGIYMPVSLKEFLYKSSAPGIEPIIPQIIIEGQGAERKLTFQGTAVFKGRKMIGSLDERETRGLALLNTGAIKRTIFNIRIPSGGREGEIALELTDYQTRVKPVINGDSIIMEIVIDAEGNLVEHNIASELGAPETVRKMELAAGQAMVQEVQRCINQSQYLESDILGWGQIISRSYPETWLQLESRWPTIFAGIKSDVKVNYELKHSYLQKKAFLFK